MHVAFMPLDGAVALGRIGHIWAQYLLVPITQASFRHALTPFQTQPRPCSVWRCFSVTDCKDLCMGSGLCFRAMLAATRIADLRSPWREKLFSRVPLMVFFGSTVLDSDL
ncbi:hypothetical protein IF2G_01551 [Cordyceps javanica]|nr:hypothetical protein IF2G_01551 [Cordyceps javanica]